jgi:hypothetical protein
MIVRGEARLHHMRLLPLLEQVALLLFVRDPLFSSPVGAQFMRLLRASPRFHALRALRRRPLAPPPSTMRRLLLQYAPLMAYRMAPALQQYERLTGQAPRPGRMRPPFTYQIVTRPPPPRTGTARQFVMLHDAQQALQFVHDVHAVQQRTPVADMISVNECGAFDGAWRKMVLDIDAPIQALDADARLGASDPQALTVQVRGLAEAIAQALHRAGLVPRPCPFAITSRHIPGRKCSWHVTLCAWAGYARWRNALRHVLQTLAHEEWPLLRFVDPAVLANSRSQYIQIVGSTKVNADAPGDGRCFRDEGLWASATTRIQVPDTTLFLAASSLMLHDPWSVPFCALRGRSTLDPEEHVLKEHAEASPPTKRSSAPIRIDPPTKCLRPADPIVQRLLLTWDALPTHCDWMRRFVVDDDTRLHWIPSNADPVNRPFAARDARQVLLHAQVRRCARCPHAWVQLGKHMRHSNTTMLYCFIDARHVPRMLMRCFSTSCGDAGQTNPPKKDWIEIKEEHWHRTLPSPLRLLAPTTPRKPVDWGVLPPPIAAWMRAPWADLFEYPLPATTPSPLLAREEGVVRVRVCGTTPTPPFCPRNLHRRLCHAPDAFLEPYVVWIGEQRLPTCAGRSYRLFLRCVHPDCVGSGAAWTELTRASLLQVMAAS